MQDIIQLLPDHLANQIAAGEVIQRPSSAVKELLENAIDAGATEIQLILKDAGKELIRVVDNGSGMSPIDARMSFERHATSKIRGIEDLFAIRTMGFRGEALASVAAVAQVELKTRRHDEETGTHLIVEATEVKRQEATACSPGTSIAIKNLFYNVPARRKFLKSNTAEYKHIVDEFTRVAMAYPKIAFRLYHNNTQQFHLTSGNLKSRIIGLLGDRMEKHLIPVDQPTELMRIYGFIGKPEVATRTRSNQFIFINNRFIRNAYLNHAIVTAFEGLVPKENFPMYVLFFDMDPQRVDVNVHPTKQEVKFDDEKILYAYLQSAVKQALAQYNIAPSIDFTLSQDIQQLEALRMPSTSASKDAAMSGYLQQSFSEKGKAFFIEKKDDMGKWQEQRTAFFPEMPGAIASAAAPQDNPAFEEDGLPVQPVIQWREYLISTLKSGLLIVNHRRAMERILYERLHRRIDNDMPVSQQMLFPAAFEIAPQDTVLFEDILPLLRSIGFDMEALGKYTYAINGIPPDIEAGGEQALLESILEDVKSGGAPVRNKQRELVLIATVKRIPKQGAYNKDEAQALIDELFACEQESYTPDGKPIYRILSKENIDNFF